MMIFLSASEVILIGTKIALDLAEGKTADEIAVLRSLAAQISATLFTYNSQNKAIETFCKQEDNPEQS